LREISGVWAGSLRPEVRLIPEQPDTNVNDTPKIQWQSANADRLVVVGARGLVVRNS